MKKKSLILFLGLIGLIALLTACVAGESSVMNSESNNFTPSAPTLEETQTHSANSPILQPLSPVDKPVLPTPEAGTGTITGIIVNQNGEPMQGLTIYLGTFDGTLIEISMRNSPRTITNSDGRFIFENIPPTDPDARYAIGIMVGADNGKIINKPGTDHTLTFDIKGGDIVDLGELKADF